VIAPNLPTKESSTVRTSEICRNAFALAFVVVALSGCSTIGGWFGGGGKKPVPLADLKNDTVSVAWVNRQIGWLFICAGGCGQVDLYSGA